MRWHFRKSHTRNKKYDAILSDGSIIPFGDVRYGHYRDTTGLGIWSHLDHNDPKRRANFHARTAKNAARPYSAAWFALRYLW